jgi:hypothetical protein
VLTNPLIRLAAIRFALIGLSSALVVTLLVGSFWMVHRMARQVASGAAAVATQDVPSEDAASRRQAGAGNATIEAAAEAKRQQCLSDNMLPGLSAAASAAISRACEEIARGDETDKASWGCVLSMRSALRTAPNPSTVLRACGVN